MQKTRQLRETISKFFGGVVIFADRPVMLLFWVQPQALGLETRTQINLKIVRTFAQEGIQFTDLAEYHYQKDSPL